MMQLSEKLLWKFLQCDEKILEEHHHQQIQHQIKSHTDVLYKDN